MTKDEIIDRRDRFCDTYNAHFNRLTEADGLSEWYRWIDDKSTQMDIVTNAIRVLGESENRYSPKLGQIKKVYNRMIRERKPNAPDFECPYCYKRGYRYLVVGILSGKKRIAQKDVKYDHTLIEKIPCWRKGSKCYWGGRWLDVLPQWKAAIFYLIDHNDRTKIDSLFRKIDFWYKVQDRSFLHLEDAEGFKNAIN